MAALLTHSACRVEAAYASYACQWSVKRLCAEQTHFSCVYELLWKGMRCRTQLDDKPQLYERKQLRDDAFACLVHIAVSVRCCYYVAHAGIVKHSTALIELHQGSRLIYSWFAHYR